MICRNCFNKTRFGRYSSKRRRELGYCLICYEEDEEMRFSERLKLPRTNEEAISLTASQEYDGLEQ